MASLKEQADVFKNEGNAAIKAHDWVLAIERYSKAIEIYDKEPAYYSNRAQAHIKSEAYGSAIIDASKAIEIDSNFVKAYYRRAVAYTAILKLRDAVKDFKTVVKKIPGDKDAKIKLADCEKLLRRNEFLAAIEVGDEPSAAEGLDLENMAVEKEYDGAKLGDEMTEEFITDMLERFKTGKKLHKKYVYQIVIAVKKIVYDEPTMVEMEIPEVVTLTVCGDTHGRFPKILSERFVMLTTNS